MRKVILITATTLALAGAAAVAIPGLATAQAPGPNPDGAGPAARPPQAMMHQHGMPQHHAMHRHGDRLVDRSVFSLMYHPADRNLSPADVQRIAEAFLLWQGNHSWKVVDVAPAADGNVNFAVATQEGSVVARFSMNAHSGKVTRTG